MSGINTVPVWNLSMKDFYLLRDKTPTLSWTKKPSSGSRAHKIAQANVPPSDEWT